jgi:hypothetical protein
MKIKQNPNEIIIFEMPGGLWLFGLFFAVIGGIFVYGSLGGFTNSDQQAGWMLALAFLMGSVGVAAGLWIIYRAPVTKVTINRLEKKVWLIRWGLFGKQESVYDFADLEKFCLIEGKDDEGDAIWNFGMKLATGEMISITSLSSHSEEYEQRYVVQTNEFMGKQLSASQLIFELEDESRDEIS